VKFRDLAWGAFVFTKNDYPPTYDSLAADPGFLHRLRTDPSVDDFQRIRDFLTHYGVPWAPKGLAAQYMGVWPKLQPSIEKLSGFSLEQCDLGDPPIADAIETAYKLLQNPHVWGSDTVASKILHFFNVHLFMMWDTPIWSYSRQLGIKTYVDFLRLMQQRALEIMADYQTLSLPGNPAEYLSKKLGYTYTRSLSKYLDDYNWITITAKWPKCCPEWLLKLHGGCNNEEFEKSS